MMKSGAAESAPLLQRDETQETNKPKPGAIAAAVRQAKRGVGVFGVALALSGVLVAVLNAPETTKKRATASSRENQNLYARAAAAAFMALSRDMLPHAHQLLCHNYDAARQEGVDRSFYPPFAAATKRARLLPLPSRRLRGVPRDP